MPANPITREKFAAQVAAALKAEGVDGAFEFDALENRLTHASRPPMPLEEHYLEARELPAHLLDQLVAAYAQMYIHPPTQPATWAEVREKVFPWVRPLSYHALRKFRAEQGEDVPFAPYGGITEHVTVCLATPTKVQSLVVTEVDLKRWGVSFEAALDQARQNVERRGMLDWQHSNEFQGVFRSPWNDEFGIARLLLTGALRRCPLRGDPVIIVPTWKRFLVAGSDDEQGLVNLGRFGRKILDTETFLVFRPMRAHGDELVHWLPPEGHPAHGLLRTLQLANECSDYAEQARAGQRFHERQEKPSNIPVPQVALMRGVEHATVVTWREGLPCALPKADYVAFKRKNEDLGLAKWADVQRVIGPELQSLGTYPPRWLARSFPADWQISSMLR